MKKKLTVLRDIFVKLSRIYKSDFYLYDGKLIIQGDDSFEKLPGVMVVELHEHMIDILKYFMNITPNSLYHIKSTDDMKSEIDLILLEYNEPFKTKNYDENEIIIPISDRISKVYPKVDNGDIICTMTEVITEKYNCFSCKDYYTLNAEPDEYHKLIEDLFVNKIYIELHDINPNGVCPNVIVTASLFPMLSDKNIDMFEYCCDKVFDDGTDILFNITSRMILDNFTIYVSYDYTDMSYKI